MTAAVERIRKEAAALSPKEQEELLLLLNVDLSAPIHEEEAVALDEEWEKALEARAREVESGAVELIPGEEFEKRTKDFVTKLLGRRP